MKITKFEDLNIWKLSILLAKDIYLLTKKQELSKDFGLRDQLQRAAVSVSSNIAEGFERNNNNEFIRYLYIAKGSLGEVRSQLFIAREISYINTNEFNVINSKLLELANQIGRFIMYLIEKKKNKEFTTR